MAMINSLDESTQNDLLLDGMNDIVQETSDPVAAENRLDVHTAVVRYIYEESAEFRKLSKLRHQGWGNPEGDWYFEQQRRRADQSDEQTSQFFYTMFKDIGRDMHECTDAFNMSSTCNEEPKVLDICMAPGGFLATVLQLYPKVCALAFSLPSTDGGYKILLPSNQNVNTELLDITLLAADMGATDIPAEHPDFDNFLGQRLNDKPPFDIIICDGQVLRTQKRASYREPREARRLTYTQLALGLEHVKQGGKMVVLFHRLEAPDTVLLLYKFSKFSSVKLYKHAYYHAKRSAFYMIASNIQRQDHEVEATIKTFKGIWKAATFGTDDEWYTARDGELSEVRKILKSFGPELCRMGRDIWGIQAAALEKAPFIKRG